MGCNGGNGLHGAGPKMDGRLASSRPKVEARIKPDQTRLDHLSYVLRSLQGSEGYCRPESAQESSLCFRVGPRIDFWRPGKRERRFGEEGWVWKRSRRENSSGQRQAGQGRAG